MFQEYIYTFLISMTPIGELRVGIPVAINVYDLNVFEAFIFAVLGNIFVAFLLLLSFKKIFEYIVGKDNILARVITKWKNRTENKYLGPTQRLGDILIVLFIAIPFPLTGAWTGSLISFLLGIPLKKALTLISIGVLIAGVIVTLFTVGIKNIVWFTYSAIGSATLQI